VFDKELLLTFFFHLLKLNRLKEGVRLFVFIFFQEDLMWV